MDLEDQLARSKELERQVQAHTDRNLQYAENGRYEHDLFGIPFWVWVIAAVIAVGALLPALTDLGR